MQRLFTKENRARGVGTHFADLRYFGSVHFFGGGRWRLLISRFLSREDQGPLPPIRLVGRGWIQGWVEWGPHRPGLLTQATWTQRRKHERAKRMWGSFCVVQICQQRESENNTACTQLLSHTEILFRNSKRFGPKAVLRCRHRHALRRGGAHLWVGWWHISGGGSMSVWGVACQWGWDVSGELTAHQWVVAYPWRAVDFGPYLVDGWQGGVASFRGKAKVSLLVPMELQHYFAPFSKRFSQGLVPGRFRLVNPCSSDQTLDPAFLVQCIQYVSFSRRIDMMGLTLLEHLTHRGQNGPPSGSYGISANH